MTGARRPPRRCARSSWRSRSSGSAGRRQLLTIVGASVVTSLAIAGQLLVGRSLLDLLADDGNVSAGDLAPYLVRARRSC